VKFLFLLLFLAFNSTIHSQFNDLTSAGNNYLQGEKFLEESKYDSAFFYLEKAGKFFYQNRNLGKYILTQNKLSYILRILGDADSSLALSKNALELSEKNSLPDTVIAQTLNQLAYSFKSKSLYDDAFKFSIRAKNILDNYESVPAKAENYSLLGLIYDETGRYDSALVFYNKAIAILSGIYGEKHPSVGSEFNNIAAVLEAKGDYQNAYDFYLKCLEIKRNAYGEIHREVAVTYNNIGANSFYRNEYDLAIEFYLKSLSIEEQLYPQDNPSFAYKYNNIAMAYRVLEDYEKALEYSLKAKNIFASALGEKHINTASVINNTGKIYFDKKEYDNALINYFSALRIFKETLGDSHPAICQIENNIGETYTVKGEYVKGLIYLKKVLSERIDLLSPNHSKVAETLNEIGKNFLYRNVTDSALYNFQQAVIVSTDSFNLTDANENPDLKHRVHDEQLLEALSLKGETFYRRYLLSGNPADLKISLANYKLCSNLVTDIRQNYKSESSKVLLTKKGFNINTKGISVAKDLYDITGDTSYFATAFELAENSKAGILSDALTEVDAKSFAGIPDSLLEKERQLKTDLTYYHTEIQKERENKSKDSIKIENYESLFFSLRREYEDLIKYFEKKYENYYQLKYKEKKYSAWEIGDRLDQKSALLEYVIGDDALYIFALTNSSHSFKKVYLNASIKDDVQSLRDALYNLDFDTYANTAYKLYTFLISPVEDEIRNYDKLYIIPDGILNYLPFESLLSSLPKNFDFDKMSYLINDYEFSYYFSASMIDSGNETTERIRGYLGFAPVFNDDSDRGMNLAAAIDTLNNFSFRKWENTNVEKFSPLPETEYEVSATSDLFRQNNILSNEYYRSQATEENIKSGLIENYDFIHIASHGFIKEDKPELSGIAFWNSNSPGGEDGILYSGEIYNLKLNADLVVLSACETGLGKIVKGEGIIGLTRGFVYSGAKNILVSLWQVADKSTSELMVEFYKNILDGKNYSSSLREAKLKLIKDEKYSYPLEWSPFVLIGN
jgi:CHAT domain-containing protein